jgi:hypothetical protein
MVLASPECSLGAFLPAAKSRICSSLVQHLAHSQQASSQPPTSCMSSFSEHHSGDTFLPNPTSARRPQHHVNPRCEACEVSARGCSTTQLTVQPLRRHAMPSPTTPQSRLLGSSTPRQRARTVQDTRGAMYEQCGVLPVVQPRACTKAASRDKERDKNFAEIGAGKAYPGRASRHGRHGRTLPPTATPGTCVIAATPDVIMPGGACLRDHGSKTPC